jgi:hypothetical protein
MTMALNRGGLALAALAATALLTACASGEAEARRQAEAKAVRLAAELAARTPPPIALDDAVAQAASVYLAFTRDVQSIRGGFETPEAVQAALRRSAAYQPDQLSRGLVAYASIVALQSPEFVAGVRQYAVDRATRETLAADIAADPRYASYLPGAPEAAGLIMATLRTDILALGQAADSVESDAYAIQAAYDPRQTWGRSEVADREGRLAGAKALSAQAMLPSAEDAQRLLEAARLGQGLTTASGDPRRPPYPPVVANALAIAALAALGQAGPEARPTTDRLQTEAVSQGCLAMSKLNLYQCLAASRPSYEDIYCVGRHAIRDLAVCTSGAAMPASIVTVSGLTTTSVQPPPPTPAIHPAPFETPPTPAAPAPLTRTPDSTNERLNTSPGG